MDPTPCPLCNAPKTDEYFVDARRPYRQCVRCGLIFVPATHHVSAAAEKAEYDRHENDPTDEGYRRFLSRLFEPINARLTPSSSGLDFGCGPGPALAKMFAESGHRMTLFDLYYANHPHVWEQQYDFITASEVVEHLREPAEVWPQLWAALRPGGTMGVMTKRVLNRDAFASWHYIRDPTHICFYSEQSFAWLGQLWQSEPEFVENDVVLFRKPGDAE